MLAALGLDKLMPGGIVLRQTIRLGGVDIRSVVTDIAETEAPAAPSISRPATRRSRPPPPRIKRGHSPFREVKAFDVRPRPVNGGRSGADGHQLRAGIAAGAACPADQSRGASLTGCRMT